VHVRKTDLDEAILLRERESEPEATRVASFPPTIRENPYQRLLYNAMRPHGIRLVENNRFDVGWFLANRRRVDVLHFHWPATYYRHERGRQAFRLWLSWVRLVLMFVRLWVARLLGLRIVWTVHELYPPETTSARLDQAAARTLARACDALIAHDDATLTAVETALPVASEKVTVIPHASYVGVYPPGRGRSAVRAELDVSMDAILFLCFGHIRDYKDTDVLLDAFREVNADRVNLLVAGLPLSEDAAEILRTAALEDPRIRLRLGYVPEEQVAELFDASEVSVVSRGDGGTSGALMLSLSLGVPVIAAARPAYEELTGGGEAGWHFRPRDPMALAAALDAAARDPDAIRTKARIAAERGAAIRWEHTAALTANVLRGA
jgi:glycosyltransferase involved in cell wall biosynthesis